MEIIMKILRNAALAAVFLLASLATLAQPVGRTIEMKVNGLVCAFCAQGIEKSLRKQAATENVFVRLKDGLVAVALKPEAELPDETLRSLLKEAGYTVVTIQRTDTPLAELRGKGLP
jgi:mercuric ion binding protein